MARGHRITISPAGQHVEVSVGGEKLAASDRAVVLNETGMPPRYYIPREDVRTGLLRRTTHSTTCPFKGEASYWSAEVGGELYENVARIKDLGIAILIVEQFADMALQVADFAAIMGQGQIQALGEPAEIGKMLSQSYLGGAA